MDQYSTTEEKSTQWGVTSKTVQNLCRQGKIDGAVKRAGAWFIPDNAPNPLKNTKSNAKPFRFIGTKRKIFDNAITLFTKNGYENVSVKDIADSIGVRQSAVYNHFASKREILDIIYDFYIHYFLIYRPSLEEIEPILENGSLLEIIMSVRYEFENDYIRQKLIDISKMAFQRQGIDGRARELIGSLMIEGGIKFVESVLDRAVEIGRLAPFDTHMLSVLINIVRMYTLNITILDPSMESINAMLKDEQALYVLASKQLTDLKHKP